MVRMDNISKCGGLKTDLARAHCVARELGCCVTLMVSDRLSWSSSKMVEGCLCPVQAPSSITRGGWKTWYVDTYKPTGEEYHCFWFLNHLSGDKS